MKTVEMEVIDCDTLKEEPTTDVNNDVQKVERLKSLELLKKKMCRSHDLIQYYNDKKKECEQLTISLRKARVEANEMKNNYNTTLSKLIKQELQNTEQRKSLETYMTRISELETKIAGDQRFIQQLNCKIDSIQTKNSEKIMDADLEILKFKEKIKTLELEMKTTKKSRITNKIVKKDQSVNTDKVTITEIDTNIIVGEKILQDKKNVINTVKKGTKQNSTFLCKKCDIALENLVKTFKAPEPIIQPLQPEKNEFKFNSPKHSKLEEKKIELNTSLREEIKHEESETMKVLTKTLKTLERVIKTNKKTEKKSKCCHNLNSCSSNNVENQNIMFELWKKLLDKDKPTGKKLKRCQNKRKSILKKEKKKKKKRKNSTNWSIESTIENNFETISSNETLTKTNEIENLISLSAKNTKSIEMKNISNLKTIEIENLKPIVTEKLKSIETQNLKQTTRKSKIKNLKSLDRENDISENLPKNENILKRKEFTLEENLETIKTSTPRKNNKFSTMENEQPKKIICQRLIENNEIIAENSENITTIEENLKNKFLIHGELEITTEKSDKETEYLKNNKCNEIEENNSTNLPKKIVISSENKKEIVEIIKIENSEKLPLNEEEIDINSQQNHLESSQESINFKGFQNLEELENSQNLENKESEENLKNSQFENKEEEILVNELKNEILDKQIENKILVKNSDEKIVENSNIENEKLNSKEKIENFDKEYKNEEKLENLDKECKNEEKIENSGKKVTDEENLSDGLLNAIDILGEISFSDESVLDCNASFLSFSTEKPQLLHISELEENEMESKENKSESKIYSEFRQMEMEMEIQNESQFIEESELTEEEGEIEEKAEEEEEKKVEAKETVSKKLQNKEKMDEANIFLPNSEIEKIPRNSIHGHRSTELRLTLISPKRCGRKRKIADVLNNSRTTRTNLLTKMRTMKKRSSEMIVTKKILRKKVENKNEIIINKNEAIINKNVINPTKLKEDDNNPVVVSKKRRIAHTPKIEDDHQPIRKSLRSASKSPGSARNSLSTIKMENSTNTRNLRNSIKIENELKIKKEEEEDDDAPIEIPIVRKRGRPRKVTKIIEENLTNFPIKKETMKKSPLKIQSSNSQNENLSNEIKIESTIIDEVKKNISLNETDDDDDLESPLSPEANNEENINNESIPIIIPSEKMMDVNNKAWEIAREALNKNTGEILSPCRELRSSRVVDNKVTKIWRDFKTLNLPHLNPMNDHMNSPFLRMILRDQKSQKELEKCITLQLNRLISNKDWTSELHFDVVEEIWKLREIKTTAKCILDFLISKFNDNSDERLDTTHTPPAPMMTLTQQKIITLISALEKKCNELENISIFEFIFDGINYTLFRLGYAPEKCVVEGLTRIFTCMTRLKKDRERARLFIIDAIYCLRFKASVAIFVVLTCWSEVFPIYDSNSEILSKCMAFSIFSFERCLDALKKLLSNKGLYNYPLAEFSAEQLAIECLSALEKKHESSIDTAIILLAKSMGPKWAQKMIIQGESGLKQLIVGKRHKSPYDAFTLLGTVMRSFPEQDQEGHLSQIVEQLCDLLDSNEGSNDHLEGVASALLCFSKYRKFFCKVSKSLLNWTPKQELRDETKQKFQYFCNSQKKNWWFDFIKSNYQLELPEIHKNSQKQNSIKQINVPKKMTKSMKKRTKNIMKKRKIAENNVPTTSQ
ncbi:putative autophagy-related protein 11 [Leptopilina boulardi]|uniref:putative autophagy-related protein 11 n=1 Tax=Leptopilina boulardi TaxID=63433 RepID=UPI0021F65BDD|nr:putative autophagy-related protein 11 [Leptopilina boulardi]